MGGDQSWRVLAPVCQEMQREASEDFPAAIVEHADHIGHVDGVCVHEGDRGVADRGHQGVDRVQILTAPGSLGLPALAAQLLSQTRGKHPVLAPLASASSC